MIDKIKKIPGVRFLYRLPFLVSSYHYLLALLAAIRYGFPSRNMTVIGVTGTKGKTTTCNLIAELLTLAGHKVCMATTVNFRIRDKVWENTTRQTMLGRLELQKFLAKGSAAGCTYAIVETSSEGILQHRERFINYRAAVITNLYPEHLDRHGGLENYKATKLKLFKQVAQRPDGIGIYNLSDAEAEYFLVPRVPTKYGYAPDPSRHIASAGLKEILTAENIRLGDTQTEFTVLSHAFTTKLLGKFNVGNVLCALTAVHALGVSWEAIISGVPKLSPVPGRMQLIDQGQPFRVVIDYAYDPNGLKAALEAMRVFSPERIIVLTGIAAGHRDRWQREAMGEVADQGADLIVVTTDDPYREDPAQIVDQVAAGALKNPARILDENIFKVVDRREGIAKALSLAKPGDLVLLAGKGGETAMKVNGQKIGWDECKVAEELLNNLLRTK